MTAPLEVEEIVRGDTVTWEFTREDETGEPIDITGIDVLCQIRRKESASTVLAEFTVVPVDLTIGRVDLVLSPAVTATLPVGLWYFDVQFTESPDVVYTFGAGSRVPVRGDISRSEP